MKYIAFFSTEEDRGLSLTTSPAGINKSAYIAQLLKETGHFVEIISPAWSKCDQWHWWGTFDRMVENGIRLHQLATFSTPLRWMTPLQGMFSLFQLFFYLLFHTHANESVLVYHSYYLSLPILAAKKIKKFKLILEVEEIYQDIIPLPRAIRRQEEQIIRKADGYILSTTSIGEKIHRDTVPNLVINGSYNCVGFLKKEEPRDGRIHCLYSGTFDPSKAGVYLAIACAEFLSDRYCIHISGVGTKKQTKSVLDMIHRTQEKTSCKIIYEGFLDNSAYHELLRKCQIGLNTQAPDQKFSDTCFPSKILVYMANGLQVVSSANKAITGSDVGDRLIYYYSQTPEAVAQAIQIVRPESGVENIKFVQKLHQNTRKNIQVFLSRI